tara:strand:- start:460 stop:576 length:117 start_codon:yes stop_codon:yes gene_type:complete
MKKITGSTNSNDVDEMLVENIIFKMWPLIFFTKKSFKA